MIVILFILFLVCLYPIIKLIIYLPLKNIFKEQSKAMISTIVITLILALFLYQYLYSTETGADFIYALLVVIFSSYVISFICAIILLLIKKGKFQPQNNSEQEPLENTQNNQLESEQTEEKSSLGIDNIIIVSIIIVLLIFAAFVMYFVWAINNT